MVTPTQSAMTYGTEAAERAAFSFVRYAQCWEDADVLLRGLDIQPGDHCLSIASAGDNALSMLTQDPQRVLAVDLNPAQLACVALRAAAYERLSHPQLLQLVGSRPSDERLGIYHRIRPYLDDETQRFWDQHPRLVERGIGSAGKFERYFALFRRYLLPIAHGERRIAALLHAKDRSARERYYHETWDTWRWRCLFHLFFSRRVMGWLGRDTAFFRYVEGSVASRILTRVQHALTELDPAQNPYLHWILTGTHGDALPHALRAENFDSIAANIGRLQWQRGTLEAVAANGSGSRFSRYNLSDMFEYMSEDAYHRTLSRLVANAKPGARLAYWNMLVPRGRPETMAQALRPLPSLAHRLHLEDKAFFYRRFVVEEVIG